MKINVSVSASLAPSVLRAVQAAEEYAGSYEKDTAKAVKDAEAALAEAQKRLEDLKSGLSPYKQHKTRAEKLDKELQDLAKKLSAEIAQATSFDENPLSVKVRLKFKTDSVKTAAALFTAAGAKVTKVEAGDLPSVLRGPSFTKAKIGSFTFFLSAPPLAGKSNPVTAEAVLEFKAQSKK